MKQRTSSLPLQYLYFKRISEQRQIDKSKRKANDFTALRREMLTYFVRSNLIVWVRFKFTEIQFLNLEMGNL